MGEEQQDYRPAEGEGGVTIPLQSQASACCAYCDGPGPLTKEHLWPTSLNQRFMAHDATAPSHHFLERSPEKFVMGEPTVKDVCATCNNIKLSRLDAYACGLYDQYFHKRIERNDGIRFAYDYDLLSRWLLKIAFNSARVHGSDTGILTYYRRHMIGQFPAPRQARFYLQLISPAVVTEAEEAATGGEVKAGTVFYPDMLRVGQATIRGFELERITGRSVILNAFAFSLFIGDRNVPEGDMRCLAEAFSKASPSARELRANEHSVELTANGFDANQALVWHYLLRKEAYGEPFRAFQEKLSKRINRSAKQ
jgi:hypothetical protein